MSLTTRIRLYQSWHLCRQCHHTPQCITICLCRATTGDSLPSECIHGVCCQHSCCRAHTWPIRIEIAYGNTRTDDDVHADTTLANTTMRHGIIHTYATCTRLLQTHTCRYTYNSSTHTHTHTPCPHLCRRPHIGGTTVREYDVCDVCPAIHDHVCRIACDRGVL